MEVAIEGEVSRGLAAGVWKAPKWLTIKGFGRRTPGRRPAGGRLEELGWTERGLWAAEGERFDNACVIVHPNHASILGRGKANWVGRGLLRPR